MATKRAITREMARRYVRARKGERSRMLDELCSLTGYSRSCALRLLCTCARSAASRPQPQRRVRTYDPETREQLRLMHELGADEIQGYFFSRPVPASECDPFLLGRCDVDRGGPA